MKKRCQLQRKQTVTKWRLLFTKSFFFIFIQLFIVLDIYLDLSRLGILPPLFTSPSGYSCIIFFNFFYLPKITWNSFVYGPCFLQVRSVSNAVLLPYRTKLIELIRLSRGSSEGFKTKSCYCRVARQALPCYTAVARLGFKRRATAVPNSIPKLEIRKSQDLAKDFGVTASKPRKKLVNLKIVSYI